jgi:6,7-dimethyl-8-ribityllumazine synthase
MANTFEGKLVGRGLKIGIVASRFNEFMTSKLLAGALDGLQRHDVADGDIDVAWVPGAREVPMVAQRMAASSKYDAVIALATVIRGATTHYEYVAAEVSRGVARIALETGVPVIFGVVTAETIEQAIERSGSKVGNRGFDAALSAIEMAQLMRVLPPRG